MSQKITICKKCKHKMFGCERCKAAIKTSTDFVTGESYKYYQFCKEINTDGRCKNFQGK
jgi:hypothetical protein